MSTGKHFLSQMVDNFISTEASSLDSNKQVLPPIASSHEAEQKEQASFRNELHNTEEDFMLADALPRRALQKYAIVDRQQRRGMPRASTKKWLKFGFRLGCTVLLFAVLFKSFAWSTLFTTLTRLDVAIVLIGLIVGVFGVIVSSYQWKSLLNGEHIHIDLARLINLYFVGIAFNHFLPTGMGGDVVKAYYVSREGGSMATSSSAVLMSRLTGLFGMFIVSISALLIWHTSFSPEIVIPFLLLVLLTSAAIAFAVFSVSILPHLFKGRSAQWPIFASIISLGNAFSVSIRQPRSLGSATLFGVFFHLETCLNYYIYAVALHLNVPLSFYFVAIPFVTLVAFLPISINGFGLRESVFVYTFSIIHIPTATSLLLAFLVDLQTLLFGLIGGGIYLAMGSRKHTSSP
jgi:glycosyltransferase 2 family protein